MTNRTPVNERHDGMLYEALRIARVPDRLANSAEKEVRRMAGENLSIEMQAMKAELSSKINDLRWMLFTFIAVATAIGLFKS